MRRTFWFLLLFVLSLAVIIALYSFPSASASYGTLSITVKNKDGSVLPGATVRVNGTVGTTDENGVVSFTNVNLYANHSIKITYLGFSVYEVSVFNASGSSAVTFTASVSSWSIKVYDASGRNAVPNATVRLKVNVLEREGRTNKDGLVTFENMPWTSGYRVRVFYAGREVFNEEKGLGENTRSIEVRAALYNLTVRVNDRSGKPVQGVEVRVWNGSTAYPVYATATSGPDGRASLKYLVSENYIVLSTYRGDVLSNETLSVTEDKVYTVSAPLQMVNVTVYNSKGTRVIRGEGYELKGQLFRDGIPYSGVTLTKDGTLRLGHAYYPRSYRLVVSFAGVEVYDGICEVNEQTASFNINAEFYDLLVQVSEEGIFSGKLREKVTVTLSLGDAFSVTATTSQGVATINDVPHTTYDYRIHYGTYLVGSGEVGFTRDMEAVTLKLRSYRLNVTLINSEGGGVPATVTVKTYDGEVLGDVKADDRGLAVLNGLIPIRYSIYVKHMGFDVGSAEDVVLDGDREITVETSVHNLKLMVLDYDGIDPIEGAEVNVKVGDARLGGTTNSSGIAIVRNVPQTTCDLSIELHGIEIYRDSLRVTSSSLRTVSKTYVYDLVVKVFDAEKMPLDKGTVAVLFGDYKLEANVTADGTARLENLPASRLLIKYYLYGVAAGEVTPDLQYDEQSVELLSKVYTVTLNYRMADGKPMSSGYVKVYLGARELMTVDVDRTGRISSRLPKGDYTFAAYYQDVEVSKKEVSVYDRVSMALDAEVYLTVLRVKDARGRPIVGAEVKISREGRAPIYGVTDSDGTFSTYLAKGQYGWQLRIGDYMLNSTYEANSNNEVVVVHLTPRVAEPYVVLGTASGIIALVAFFYSKKFIKRRATLTRPALRRQKSGGQEGESVQRRRLPRI